MIDRNATQRGRKPPMIPAMVLLAMLFPPVHALRSASAGDLGLQLVGDQVDRVTFVGAYRRWDRDGNPRRQVDPNAKIDRPQVDAVAKSQGGGKWVFRDLPAGRYDLVVLRDDRTRIEGWHYPPVVDFDPFFPPEVTLEDETVEAWIRNDIEQSRHYENIVKPLYLGGDDQVVRALVMLLRDQPTSYEGTMPGAATLRFEVWQYDNQYGGWSKNKQTRVLHRVIMPRSELRKWTWLWHPGLGNIEVGLGPLALEVLLEPENWRDFNDPAPVDEIVDPLKGLRPD